MKVGNLIQWDTIGDLEKIMEELAKKGASHASQKGATTEVLGNVIIINNPEDGDQYPFWTEEQTKWYLDNFVFLDSWIEISKNVAKKIGRNGSSYCYHLRYFQNDGGMKEINTVLNAVDTIPADMFPINSFLDLYKILEPKVLPDIVYSVLKYLKYEQSVGTEKSLFDRVKYVMKHGHKIDLPCLGYSDNSDGVVYFPEIRSNFYDQVVNELKKDQTSRRAFISGIFNLTDVAGRVGRPPFSVYQAQIRDGLVISSIYMRSNDMLWGAQLDLHHGLEFAKKIADETGTNVGPIILQSGSAHAYTNIPALEKYGMSNRDEVRGGRKDAMKLWLAHVTSTPKAEHYPEL